MNTFLYIIDGDLEWVRGDPAPIAPTLYRHDAYCIENFLICKHAITIILSQEQALLEKDAATRLGFDTWQREICESLIALFAAYATQQSLCPQQPTVSQGVGCLCTACGKGKPSSLDKQKVELATTTALSLSANAKNQTDTDALYNQILTRVKSLPHSIDAISGKDFLLPLLLFHLQRFNCRLKTKSMRMRLASNCQLERFDSLQKAIKSVAQKGTL